MSSSQGKHITIRAPEALRTAIQEYAKRQGTSVTQLTLDYYRALLAADMKQEADQV